jgi:hypothetical protein
MGRRVLLLPAFPRRLRVLFGPEENASNQLLQPTCCHENPLDRSAPELQACALCDHRLDAGLSLTLARRLDPSACSAGAE